MTDTRFENVGDYDGAHQMDWNPGDAPPDMPFWQFCIVGAGVGMAVILAAMGAAHVFGALVVFIVG